MLAERQADALAPLRFADFNRLDRTGGCRLVGKSDFGFGLRRGGNFSSRRTRYGDSALNSRRCVTKPNLMHRSTTITPVEGAAACSTDTARTGIQKSVLRPSFETAASRPPQDEVQLVAT